MIPSIIDEQLVERAPKRIHLSVFFFVGIWQGNHQIWNFK